MFTAAADHWHSLSSSVLCHTSHVHGVHELRNKLCYGTLCYSYALMSKLAPSLVTEC